MSTQDPENTTPGPRSDAERHQALICAYVLDEVDQAQRVEAERLLASSPVLRAEKARLEATIGLVRESYPPESSTGDPGLEAELRTSATGETLSTQATAAVVAAARARLARDGRAQESSAGLTGGVALGATLGGRRLLSFARSGYFQVAAALVVGIGLWSAYRAGTADSGGQRLDYASADAPFEEADVARMSAREPSVSMEQAPDPRQRGESHLRETLLDKEGLEGNARGQSGPALKRIEQDAAQVAAGAEPIADGALSAQELRKSSELDDVQRELILRAEAKGVEVDALDPTLEWRGSGKLPSAEADGSPERSRAAAGRVAEDARRRFADRSPERAADRSAGDELALGRQAAGLPSETAPTGSPAETQTATPQAEESLRLDGRGRYKDESKTGSGLEGASLQPTPGAGGEAAKVALQSRLQSPDRKGPGGPGPSSPASQSPTDSHAWRSPVAKSPAPPARGAVAGTRVVQNIPAGEKSGVFRSTAQELRLGFIPYLSDSDVEGTTDFFLGGGGGGGAELGLPCFGVARARALSSDEAAGCLLWLERDCRRRPSERPRDMFFRFWGDNPFVIAAADPLSTFAADVDTASYTLARRMLREGYLPPKEQVRTEEFVNYFTPDVEAPLESTFRIATELAPSRFGPGRAAGSGGQPDHWMLRVALRGKDVSRQERDPLALTFVVDTSGSMKENGRLELVKHALRLLLGELDTNDSIALVAFSREARLVLPMTSAGARGVIESALYPLTPDGGTNAEAGLKMGYEVALAGFTEGAVNRVVFLSDGVANIGQVDQDRLNEDVRRQRESGIYLNTIGVGLANHNDVFLEQLANKGDGRCDYVDGHEGARHALVDNFVGAFQPIARDVKIQVEFDPQQVLRYRLLGYENRAVADADFRNDAVDAGEVGAGHQVCALYELVLTGRAGAPDTGFPEGAFATVRVRWKAPHSGAAGRAAAEGGDGVTEIEQPVSLLTASSAFEQASPGYRRSVLAAQFAEFLRRSIHAHGDSLDDLIAEAKRLRDRLRPGDDETREFEDFVALTETARGLLSQALASYGPLERSVDDYRWKCFDVERRRERGAEALELEELEREVASLLDHVRELLEATPEVRRR